MRRKELSLSCSWAAGNDRFTTPLGKDIETEHFLLQFDPNTGAIHRLRNKQTTREWASPEHPLALFSYQTLSQEDYQKFLASYLTTKADWAQKDFGKPNIERFGARSQTWSPKLVELRVQRIQRGSSGAWPTAYRRSGGAARWSRSISGHDVS